LAPLTCAHRAPQGRRPESGNLPAGSTADRPVVVQSFDI
jgi:hypothetical protein